MTTDKTAIENENQPSHLGGVSGGRSVGKTNALIEMIAHQLSSREILNVKVIGCKNPNYIIDRLLSKGVHVKSVPLFNITPMRAIHDMNSIEGEMIGIEGGEKVQVGYLFYRH